MNIFEKEKPRLSPLHGIALFLIIMLLFFFVFAPLQYRFGMIGLLLTELGLLFVTLLAVFLTRQPLREVFPMYRPRFGQLMGTILLWIGCFLFTITITLVSMLFFPDGFQDTSTDLISLFASIPTFFSFLIVAVSPAICEEAMHRGFIMHTFRGISRDWVAVLCIGLIFGLFHADPYRFLPTALLGMGLAYIMRKSKNILLPSLFHFINNAIAFFAGLGSASLEVNQPTNPAADPSFILIALGSYLIIGCLAPILLYAGSYLLCKSSGCLPKVSNTRLVLTIIGVLSLSIAMLISGFVILFLNMGTLMDLSELSTVLCFTK